MAKGEVAMDPAGREIVLGDIGTEIVFENELVRVWEVLLEPGEVQTWHRHHHPYLVIAIEEAHNVMEFLDGSPGREMHETVGRVVYREAGKPHNLRNAGTTRYRSRLVELKGRCEGGAGPDPAVAADEANASQPGRYSGAAAEQGRMGDDPDGTGSDGAGLDRFAEVILDPDCLEWAEKSLTGLSQKMLWRDDTTGASIALVRFLQGSGVPSRHEHASNQFMYCLSGRYTYTSTGITLTPGSFYWNPKGSLHGPTLAEQDSVLLEFYDGPHYSSQPEWYNDPEDAR